MSSLSKNFLVIVLLAALATPVSAQRPLPPALPGSIQWAPIPGVQGVQYAPDLGLDVFRYGRAFYCFN